jgi:hypothetical protein
MKLLSMPLLLLVALTACTEDSPTAGQEPLQLRIANDLSVPIAVEVRADESVPASERLNVNFGTLQPGQVTAYREVSPTVQVFVDGTRFPPGQELKFGIANPPSPRWMLRIQVNGSWDQYAEFD